MRRYRIWIVLTALLAALFIGALFLRSQASAFFYPRAEAMPSNIDASLEELLARLEELLKERAPKAYARLEPGIASGELQRIEAKLGVQLSDELRTLYSWHNGMSDSSEATLFSIYPFPSLNRLADERTAGQLDLRKASFLQRTLHSLMLGHRESWIAIFPDGAGDGYYVDLSRPASQGAVFYNFTEDVHYVFYPSLKNLIAAIVECYEAEVYSDRSPAEASPDTFMRAMQIHGKYGAANQ